ncbi:MAG: outer membrane beta-barrel protein, partial [Afipia sp.]|nr:outer membrane beta-barrel protein [Afipia sp.]
AGFNYQLGSIVTGIEGTWSGLDHKTTIASPYYPGTDTQTTKISNIVTIAGRLGVTWDRVLFYGKGGWAGGEVQLSAASNFGGGSSAWNPGSRFRSGVIVGAGFEYMLTQNFILGIEYNHIDLGRASYTAYNTGANTSLTSVDDKTKLDTIVGRLSYKFAPPGAVASR